jgi:TRAP-type mannitol/chloroaromatic compound transport system substrate-binding protein
MASKELELGLMAAQEARPDRRRVLGLGLGLAGSALASPASAADPVTWKMATAWPKEAPGVGVNARRLADKITTLSGGRLTVKLFAAGELVPADQVFDAVSTGTAELGHGASYYWQSKDPAFHFFTAVPFGLTATEHAGWIYFGGGAALWERAYEPFGVIPFYAGSSGPQAAGWFMKEIRTLEDLRGVTIRIEGLGGEVMRRLGATVVSLKPDKFVSGMKDGTVNAVEWIGPANDLAIGLSRTAQFYYMPGFHEIGPALELTVNRAAYEGLTDDLKAVIRTAAMASASETLADFTHANIRAMQTLIDQGIEIRSFPVAVIKAAAREADALLKEVSAASPMAGEVYDAFIDYRDKAAAYCRNGELAALKIRELGLAG